MADDFDDIYDIGSMSDDELEALIREELDEQPALDPSGLDLTVTGGRVHVGGRVGTEAELQIIEHLLTDVLGVASVENELVVDELVRLEQPEGADEANAALYDAGTAHGGADRTEDSAEHLLEDTAAEQFGTEDPAEAVERGHTYNPPTGPVQEGTWNKEEH